MIPPLENARRADLFNLALLTGRPPAQADRAAEACTKPPVLTRPLPAGNGAALLARRPDIREADRRLAAETARIGVATASLFPQVVFAGSVVAARPSLGYATSSSRGLSFAIGPVVSWTFPNLEVARARIAQARASTREAYAAYEGTVLGALNETERALSAYITETNRNAELRTAVQRQQKALAIATAGARLGAVPPPRPPGHRPHADPGAERSGRFGRPAARPRRAGVQGARRRLKANSSPTAENR